MSKLILVALLGFLTLVQSTTPVYNIDNYLVATELPLSLWMSPFQNLFIGSGENKIYRYNGLNSQVVIAGGGSDLSPSAISAAGAATSAHFYSVHGICGDPTERYIYFTNTEHNNQSSRHHHWTDRHHRWHWSHNYQRRRWTCDLGWRLLADRRDNRLPKEYLRRFFRPQKWNKANAHP